MFPKYIATTVSFFFQAHLHIQIQLPFSNGKKKKQPYLSPIFHLFRFPSGFSMLPNRTCLALSNSVLQDHENRLQVAVHEKAKGKSILWLSPNQNSSRKGKNFVCMNTFLFSKSIFKKFLNLGAICHPYSPHQSSQNVPIPFSSPSQSQPS